MKTKDYPLGSTFEHDGTVLIVADDRNDLACNDCWFGDKKECKHPHCSSEYRIDGKEVIFEKLDSDEKA